jgi:hypothetical protein
MVPDLQLLWEREVEPTDEIGRARLDADLSAVEEDLSAYRSALHRRIDSATTELIARYRENPKECLRALPLTSNRLPRPRTAS